ncbi:Crp/Fnr family transcriptional regulator [Ciceribacter sp. L1K23]|uniref:Crp/Fnr family transcriptional regulator n=1 Tax=unclassified Ciceribacter TaxID=2628820 RepID=UPI001ABE6071|nr:MULTISPECIES: Crp/Fnr family transcriptional regulator [unclassified Ciceribacter]MBO3758720.1 Crp/Fnr family transcriptional regulator [Ciceribacter sp. L1K22]MBR0557330.1 Crp/Fnr family transcriptional regulator [Ciceribacter sp. L1K23]
MARQVVHHAARVPCHECPLRECSPFREFTEPELDFMEGFKKGELITDRGTTIVAQASHGPHFYTVLSGMAFRYKLLEDGRRQILNYLFPGDLMGLQSALLDEMQHSVEALTPMKLCIFEKEKIGELYRKHAGLAYDITWIAAQEERILDEHLLSVGRRSAIERAAYLLAFLSMRAKSLRRQAGINGALPITQTHVADTLGLSIVHTNKTLRKLQQRGMVRWLERGCEILDETGLQELAGWEASPAGRRPFI